MEFSLCTITLRDLPVEQVFPVMRRYGYRYADIFAKHLPVTMSLPEVEKLGTLARSHGVEVISFASGVGDGLADDDPAKRQAGLHHVMHCIDQAAVLGAGVIRTGLGGVCIMDERMKGCVLPAMEQAAAYAEKKKVKLGVENHSGGITQTIQGCVDLCSGISSRQFGILYDPGNLLGLLEDYKKVLELMPERIVHVHLKDGFPHYFGNDGFAPQRLSCTAFGEGKLDIPFILRELQRTGYSGYVSVEYESWHPEYHLPPPEQGLPHCIGFLRGICAADKSA